MNALPSSPAPRHAALPVLAALLTVVLWASAFIGVRWAGHDYSPGALALMRQLAGSLMLTLIVLALRRGRLPALPPPRLLTGIAAWGVGWFGVYNLALNAAEQHLDAGTTALLVNVAPILVAVLAGVFLREGFPLRIMLGMAVAFGGVVLIAVTTSQGHAEPVGVLLGLAAAVLYALGATAQKRLLRETDPLTMTWLGCLAGTLAVMPFGPALLQDLASAPSSATLTAVYLGVFPTAIAFLSWGYALSFTSAGRLASFTYLVPPLAVLLSWRLLSEVPPALALIGGALCLAGVGMATGLRMRRRVRPGGSARHGASPQEPSEL